jgi:hypothetical protein
MKGVAEMLRTSLKISRFVKLSVVFAFVVLVFSILSPVSYACETSSNCTILTTFPSGKVSVIPLASSGDGYFDVNISGLGLHGKYSAFCISPSVPIFPNYTYVADVKSSYDTSAIPVKYPENLDLVNYILNQDIIGQDSVIDGPFTYKDIQLAIWALLCDTPDDVFIEKELGTVDWSAARVQEIIDTAKTFGEGYIPQLGGYMALAFINLYSVDVFNKYGAYGTGQAFLIMIPVQCKTCDQGCNQGCNQGSNQWYNQGSNQGCNQGSNQWYNQEFSQWFRQEFSQWYNQGSNQGCNQGSNQWYNQGSSQGHNQGYNQGSSQGHNQGYNQGSSQGHNQGYNSSCRR